MKKTFLLVAATWVSGAAVLGAAEIGADVVQNIQHAISRERVSRQQIEEGAQRLVKNGNEAFFRGAYQQAINHYLEAIKVLRSFGGDEGSMKDKIRRCREQIAQSYYYIAQDLVLKADDLAHAKDYDEAIRNCKEAIAQYPEGAAEIRKRIAEYEKVRDKLINRDAVTAETLMPDEQERNYRIEVLLRQGYALYENGLFDQAKRKYDSVLTLDPYNAKAMRGLEAANIRIDDSAFERFKNVHRERMAEEVWKFAVPILPENSDDGKKVVDTVITKSTGVDGELQEKLRSIVIPRIDFEDISVPTAIKYLREQSKVHDPKHEGVNIHLLQLPPTAAQIAARQTALEAAKKQRKESENSEEGEGAEESEGGEVKIEDPNQVINLVLTKKTIGEAIHYLCKAAKLKSRIDKNVVVIAPESVELDEIKWRVYPIEAASLAGLEGGGTDPEVLKKHFMERGVRFPTGAVIVYKPRFSRIVATNTEENLRRINEIIQNELTARDPNVQIQARIVEIEQNNLDALTFNYSLGRSAQTSTETGRLEFESDSASLLSNPNQGAKLIDFSGTDTNSGFTYGFSVYALNQLDSRDVLSSPRVTTLNGQLATIRMLTEVYFVDDYDDPQTSVSTNSTSSGSTTSLSTSTYTYIGAFPNFEGDPKELGISLPVIPNVDIKSRTIRLDFSPTIQSFAGWTVYTYDEDLGGTTMTTVLRKPKIAARRINTRISIYDGETIVIGGVLKDDSAIVLNKVPFLGDLPLVGRLFQSRSTKSTKTNLLIFLTCRLVKPDGTPFSPDSVRPRGVPSFGRIY